MDKPLVPDEMSGKTRNVILGVFVVLIGFVLATIIIAVLAGIGKETGFAIIGIALAILLVGTSILLNWYRQDKLEDKIKYIVISQVVALIVISAALLAVIYVSEDPASYTLAGSAFAAPQGYTLTLNGAETIQVPPGNVPASPSSAFSFNTKLQKGASWSVTMDTNTVLPASTCTLDYPSTGSMPDSDYLPLRVTCRVSVGGSVTGLTKDGLELAATVNGVAPGQADTIQLANNQTAFQFANLYTAGSYFQVAITKGPSGQNCNVDPDTSSGQAWFNALGVRVICS